jgi:hypothetical protein
MTERFNIWRQRYDVDTSCALPFNSSKRERDIIMEFCYSIVFQIPDVAEMANVNDVLEMFVIS